MRRGTVTGSTALAFAATEAGTRRETARQRMCRNSYASWRSGLCTRNSLPERGEEGTVHSENQPQHKAAKLRA